MTIARPDGELYLVDLLDRLLAGGVVLSGDITISLAGVDLVQISVRALISSVATLMEEPRASRAAQRASDVPKPVGWDEYNRGER